MKACYGQMRMAAVRAGAAILAAAFALPAARPAAAQSGDLSGNGLAPNASSGVPAGGSSSKDLRGITDALTSGQPQAQVDQKVYDFGNAINGAKVSHIFKIRNTGSGTLIIGGVQTSCGCTAAKPTKSSLGPGEQTDIAVTFDTHFDKGTASRTITVFTNDPHAAQILMTLKGDIKVEVDATPAQVAFGEVKRGTELTRQVLINDLEADKAFQVTSVTNANPNIKVTHGPRADGKRGAALMVTLLGSMPVGAFDDMIKVATSRAPLELTVFGTVDGNLTVKPAQVSFGIVPHHQSALRIVRLLNAGGRAVNVLGVSSTNLSVDAAVEPVIPGREYKVTLELRPNTPDGALRGEVAIKTDDPEQRTVNLPFYAIVGSFKG